MHPICWFECVYFYSSHALLSFVCLDFIFFTYWLTFKNTVVTEKYSDNQRSDHSIYVFSNQECWIEVHMPIAFMQYSMEMIKQTMKCFFFHNASSSFPAVILMCIAAWIMNWIERFLQSERMPANKYYMRTCV